MRRKALSIPYTVRVPVTILQRYVSDQEHEDDWRFGFFTKQDGHALAPVMRNPTTPPERTSEFHARSRYSELGIDELTTGVWVRVAKGAGIPPDHHTGVPFDLDEEARFDTQRFQGGELEKYARHQAEVARAIRQAYEEAILDGNPTILLARQKYGITDAPVPKPRYLLRPEFIPIVTNGHVKWINRRKAIRQALVGRGLRAWMKGLRHWRRRWVQANTPAEQQVVYVYDIPLMERIHDGLEHLEHAERREQWMRKLRQLAGHPQDDRRLLEQFSARLAVALHLLHHRLDGTFTMPTREPDAFLSSISETNVTMMGYVMDLDVVQFLQGSPHVPQGLVARLNRDQLAFGQERDRRFAYQAIESMGRVLKLEDWDIGWLAFNQVYDRLDFAPEAEQLFLRSIKELWVRFQPLNGSL